MDPRELLGRDLVLHLVTLRRDGSPRITPLWFLYENDAFHMTSGAGKPHLRDLTRDARCAVIVDAEIDPFPDGERRYARVRASGDAELLEDLGKVWTKRITRHYVHGAAGEKLAERRARDERILVTLRPERLSATTSRARTP